MIKTLVFIGPTGQIEGRGTNLWGSSRPPECGPDPEPQLNSGEPNMLPHLRFWTLIIALGIALVAVSIQDVTLPAIPVLQELQPLAPPPVRAPTAHDPHPEDPDGYCMAGPPMPDDKHGHECSCKLKCTEATETMPSHQMEQSTCWYWCEVGKCKCHPDNPCNNPQMESLPQGAPVHDDNPFASGVVPR